MNDATSAAMGHVLRQLLAGQVDVREAARQLHDLAPRGLVLDSRALTPEERARLNALVPALRWEMVKTITGGVPDVPFGSPEHKAFMASMPRALTTVPTTVPDIRVHAHVTVRGRELRWLSRLVSVIFGPIFRWRAKRWGTGQPQ